MRGRNTRSRTAPDRLSGPLVAIIGRPNVGKSTLFNRLVGAPMAVVGPQEGITRDRHYAGAEWDGHRFTIVDTGGFVAFESDHMTQEIKRQVLVAVEEAELIILVVDAGPGPTDLDLALAKVIRKTGRNTLVLANKVDRPSDEAELHRFLALGLGDAVPVSALHGRRIAETLDEIIARLPAGGEETVSGEETLPEEETAHDEAAVPGAVSDPAADRIRIAVVGRPNVGKSSLVNRILGADRMIVADSSGTTRDSVDTRLDLDGERFTLIDTAGLRRAARRDPGVEYWSALRSERAIARSDVVLLVIEAGEAGTAQDARIAALCEEMGRGIILVVNKWDLVPAESREREAWERYLRREFRFIAYAPIAYVSAVTGTGVKQLLPLAARIWRERRRRIPDDRVEDILMNAVRRRPPSGNGRRGVLFAARQTGFAPPLFALNVNYPALFEDEYMRYLVNRMRREIPFEGTPIRFDLRTGRPRDARDAGNGEKTERSRGRKGRAGTRVRE